METLEPTSDFVRSERTASFAPGDPLQRFEKIAGPTHRSTPAFGGVSRQAIERFDDLQSRISKGERSFSNHSKVDVGSSGLPTEEDGTPIESSTMGRPDPRFTLPPHGSTVAEFSEKQAATARKRCLRDFSEAFATASAFVLDVNQKNGWWEDPEAAEAANALDAFAYAKSTGKIPPSLCPDFVHAIDSLGAVAKKLAERQPRNDFEAFALIISEVAEAIESRREGLAVPDDKIPEFSGIEAELADVVIRIMDMSAARGWRVGEAIAAKLEMNAGRGHRHGGKLA